MRLLLDAVAVDGEEAVELTPQSPDGMSVHEAAQAVLSCEDFSGVPERAAQRSAQAQADMLAGLISMLAAKGVLTSGDVLSLLPGYKAAP